MVNHGLKNRIMNELNWISIDKDGYPKKWGKYLVTDGVHTATSDTHGTQWFKYGQETRFIFKGWAGCEETQEDNDCCSGIRYLDFTPTHYVAISDIKLPT